MSKLNVTTSTTRPASPNTGSIFFESDTNKLIFWDGSVWHLFDRDSVTAAAPTLVGGYLDIGGSTSHTIGDYMAGNNYADVSYKQVGALSTSRILTFAIFAGYASGDPEYNKLTVQELGSGESQSGQDETALTWYIDSNASTIQDLIDATSSMVQDSDFTTPVPGTYMEVETANLTGTLGSVIYKNGTSILDQGSRCNFPTPTEQ